VGGVLLGFCLMPSSAAVVAQAADYDGSQCVITVPVNSASIDDQAVELKYVLTKGGRRRITRICILM